MLKTRDDLFDNDYRHQFAAEIRNATTASRHHYERLKVDMLNDLMQGCCEVCGDTRIYLLSLHHVDPSSKKLVGVADIKLSRTNYLDYWREAKGCSVLCMNCHADMHHRITRGMKRPVRIYRSPGRAVPDDGEFYPPSMGGYGADETED
jgi:hypothetical protein